MNRLKESHTYAEYFNDIIDKHLPKIKIYCIYFPKMRAFKVGRTNNIDRRLRNIRWEYNEPHAEVFASIDGSKEKEKRIHRKLKKYKSNTDGLLTDHREVYDVCWELSEKLVKIFDEAIIKKHFEYCFKLHEKGVFNREGEYIE